MSQTKKKVLVSGCYDLLHGGHIEFFRTAAEYGDLYVCLGSDATIEALKHRPMMFSQDERLFMVQAVRYVHEARISRGSGLLDFEPEMVDIQPDIHIVNEDGFTEAKRDLCKKHGVELIILPRVPAKGLPERSSTSVKAGIQQGGSEDWEKILPYRICVAGGWLDQPWVSSMVSGAVITLNLQPDVEFRFRGGMATSSRERWKTVAPSGLLADDPVELARLLFGYENPPGSKYVSGSQDHLGLTLPGANYLHYNGGYWVDDIQSIIDEETCQWLEGVVKLVRTCDRPDGFDPLAGKQLTTAGIQKMAAAADLCWQAIQEKDTQKLGDALTESYRATVDVFPGTMTEELADYVSRYDGLCCGRNISGAGGGGYLTLISEQPVDGEICVKVRR